LAEKFTVNGGFARIDTVMFNGDRFPVGNRPYLGAVYKFNREFSISSIIIHAVGPLPSPQAHRTRFEIIFTYNALETLHKFKIL
jgi:hypothetical protein